MRNFGSTHLSRGGRITAYLLVNLATLLWSGNVVLGRALHREIGPWSLACVRALLASLLFAGVLWQRRQLNGRPSAREWGLLLGMAMSGVVLFQGLMYTGLHHTTAVNAGVINGAGPLLTVLLSWMIIADPVGPIQICGALVSLIGVMTITSGGSLSVLLHAGFNRGDILVLLAVTFWGTYSVLARILLRGRDTFWVTGISTALAVPLLLVPAGLELRHSVPTLTPALVLAILYIGAGPSFVAFMAWNEGVRRLGATGAMSFYNTLPLYTAILSWATLGEAPGPAQWLGGGLVVAGCLLATRASKGARRRPA